MNALMDGLLYGAPRKLSRIIKPQLQRLTVGCIENLLVLLRIFFFRVKALTKSRLPL